MEAYDKSEGYNGTPSHTECSELETLVQPREISRGCGVLSAVILEWPFLRNLLAAKDNLEWIH